APAPGPAPARSPVPVAAPAPVPAAGRVSGATIAPGRLPFRPAPAAVARQEPWLSRLARSLRGWRTVLVFAFRRTLSGLVVLWVVTLGTFLLFFTRPAISVARSMAGKEPTAAQLRQITRQLGRSQPIPLQYWHFTGRLLHGNLGYSYATRE